MLRIKAILKDKRGVSFPLTIAIALSLLLVFCGISEYFRLVIIAQGVRDAVQSAVITTVNDNYDDVYHGVREGYSGGYWPTASSFTQSLDYGEVYYQLDRTLGLTANGGYHEKQLSNGNAEYRIWGLNVNIRNAPFASGDIEAARFEADCSIMLEVPVSFCGEILPPLRINIKTSAGYTPIF